MDGSIKVHLCAWCDRIDTVHIRNHGSNWTRPDGSRGEFRELWLCPVHEEQLAIWTDEQYQQYLSTVSC